MELFRGALMSVPDQSLMMMMMMIFIRLIKESYKHTKLKIHIWGIYTMKMIIKKEKDHYKKKNTTLQCTCKLNHTAKL